MEFSAFLTAINTIIAFSALMGNGMVIVVMMIRRKQFSSLTNKLILHQSIIDFISGAVFFFLEVVLQPLTSMALKVDRNIPWELLCRFVISSFLVTGFTVASTYNLVIISLERFMATCYPVKHRNSFTYFRIKVAMGAAWAIGFIYALPDTVAWRFDVDGVCDFNNDFAKILFPLGLLVEYIIPVTLMVFGYGRIFVALQIKLAGAQQRRNGVLSKAKRNVLETMLIAGIMFLICWSPFQILKLLLTTRIINGDTVSRGIFSIFRATIMCNMSVNPIIYCFKYEHFRSQLLQLLRGRFRRNQVHAGAETNAVSMSMDPIQQTVTTQAAQD